MMDQVTFGAIPHPGSFRHWEMYGLPKGLEEIVLCVVVAVMTE